MNVERHKKLYNFLLEQQEPLFRTEIAEMLDINEYDLNSGLAYLLRYRYIFTTKERSTKDRRYCNRTIYNILYPTYFGRQFEDYTALPVPEPLTWDGLFEYANSIDEWFGDALIAEKKSWDYFMEGRRAKNAK